VQPGETLLLEQLSKKPRMNQLLFEIPFELWCHIVSHLNVLDSIGFVTVSKTFCRIVYESITDIGDTLQSRFQLYLYSSKPRAIKNNEMIERFPNLKKLNLNGKFNYRVTDIGLKTMKSLISLSLIDNTTITDDGIKELFNLNELELSLNNSITNIGIRNLLNIRYLHLYANASTTDEGIEKLMYCT
jgi:hypothetical protein